MLSKFTVMIGLTGVFMLAELVVGIYGDCLSLQVDAFHMVNDLLALTLGYVSERVSKRPKSNVATYGWLRAQTVGGLVNSLLLVGLMLGMVSHSIERVINPALISKPWLVLWVGSAGLVVNLIGLAAFVPCLSKLFSRDREDDGEHGSHGSHGSHGDHIVGVIMHLVADAAGSVAVVASTLVVIYTESDFRLYLDPAISLLMSVVLIAITVPIAWKMSKPLLQLAPQNVDLEIIKKELLNIDGVNGIHELHMWTLANNAHVATVHLEINITGKDSTIVEQAKRICCSHGAHSTTIQVEFSGFPNILIQDVKEDESCHKCVCPPI
jgi:zinc transporter 1